MDIVKDDFYGALVKFPETTHQLVAGVVDLPQARHSFWDHQYQYYQPDVSKVSCTIHGPATACSALTGEKFSHDDLQFFWTKDLSWPVDPAVEGVGGYVYVGVDIIRKNYTKEALETFGFKLGSPEAESALDKNYMLVCSFGGNVQYNIDKKDGILDLTSLSGNASYYHCLTMCKDKDDPTMMHVIVDNYYYDGSTTNTYKVPRSHIAILVSNKVFDENCYVFAYKADLAHPPSLISPWAVNSVEKAKTHGITNWDNPQEPLTPELARAILFKVGVFTKEQGACTKEDFIVALDRLKVL